MFDGVSRRGFLKLSGAAAIAGIGATLSGCGGGQAQSKMPEASSAGAEASTEKTSYSFDGNDFVMKLKNGEKLYTECDQKGTVEEIYYDTHAYAVEKITGESNIPMQKRMFAYLPYGYDPSKQYNVLYLMHGGGESEIYWLTSQDGKPGQSTCNLLDNLVKEGKCADTIVVSPTFNATPEGYEDVVADYLGYDKDGGKPSGDSEPKEGDPEIAFQVAFADELRNEVIPTIESRYSTFAGGDVSDENLVATRDHRGFAGFSMGSCTTFHAGIMHNLDCIGYFGNFSGGLADSDELAGAILQTFSPYDLKFWYNGNGSADIAHDEHKGLLDATLPKLGDKVKDAENYAWVEFKGGTHSFNCWILHLYNCMLVFFEK